MFSLRSIAQIICKARTLCSTPVNRLHAIVNMQPTPSIAAQLLKVQPAISKDCNSFLRPSIPLVENSCGMKVRRVLQRRCKDCRLVFIDGVLHNLCKTYGRHTQRKKMPHFKATRIVTDAFQSKVRPW